MYIYVPYTYTHVCIIHIYIYTYIYIYIYAHSLKAFSDLSCLEIVGQNLGEILPTSLPKLPTQLRDLRNNQKSSKIYFLNSIKKLQKKSLYSH